MYLFNLFFLELIKTTSLNSNLKIILSAFFNSQKPGFILITISISLKLEIIFWQSIAFLEIFVIN